MVRALALVLIALAAPLVLAKAPRWTEPLVYRWPVGETLHYRAQLYLHTPGGTRLFSAKNTDARSTELTMALLLRCQAREPMERYQAMECKIHRSELGGTTGAYNEDAKLLEILREYQGLLDASVVQLEWSLTGRVRTVDVEGPAKNTDRQATVQ